MAVFNFETYKHITELSSYVSPVQIVEIMVNVIEGLEESERAAVLELFYERYFSSCFDEGELD
ncbi:MAG: hypothetical protein AB2421_15530 [Thermotaleaceae bacterium]